MNIKGARKTLNGSSTKYLQYFIYIILRRYNVAFSIYKIIFTFIKFVNLFALNKRSEQRIPTEA